MRNLKEFRDLRGGAWPDAFAGRRGQPRAEDFQEASLAQTVARVAQTYSDEIFSVWEKRKCSDWLRLAGYGDEVAGHGGGGDDSPGGGGLYAASSGGRSM